MSLAVADWELPAVAGEPPSYEERARLILLRHPGLFPRPVRGGGLSVRGREPQVQSGSRAAPRGRRGARQLSLPLQSIAAAMLG